MTMLVQSMIDTLPADIVVDDPDIVAAYARDQSKFTDGGMPFAVLVPRTTAEVSVCMAAAHRHRVAVVPRGAGSGLSGAANATAGSVVLSLHRMNTIREIDVANRLAVIEPGVITADLRARVSEAGLFYPPDPGSVEFSTVGGNVATNAGGMCCVKYGVTGDFVLGLEVVLADGRVLRTGRRTVKGVAGYDLTHLLVGSEGTLGVITEITVELLAAPRPAQTLVASFPTLDGAGRAVAEITSSDRTPSMLEILDRTTVLAVDRMSKMGIEPGTAALLLVQSDDVDAEVVLASIETMCSQHGAVDVVVSADQGEAALLLEARRLALPALELLGDWLLDDVAVPRSRVTDLIASIETIAEEAGLTIGVFGHAGDGNLHPTIIYDDADADSRAAAMSAFDAITRRALELGGTITGEHGVGRLKTGWLTIEHDETSMAVQRSVKDALDPSGILNPGAVLR
ncbi:FAD-binding oxidoreductase [Rhodococcus sp. RS1C4]|nr:FAD-binding oxidoreductase [Rhodococcus sp. 06-621-2]OZC54507.1 FAD-binding oxidoreductase [Rhodococcus sp. RS1C4]OZE83062.1 FAD-binding oxidoreductase [Rhodococcus sp. 15-649-1-2]OZF06991.1 FAD-binding oxidoreductase [Rhodococcus sp. 15-1154-1]